MGGGSSSGGRSEPTGGEVVDARGGRDSWGSEDCPRDLEAPVDSRNSPRRFDGFPMAVDGSFAPGHLPLNSRELADDERRGDRL